jgi:hypothetical protein
MRYMYMINVDKIILNFFTSEIDYEEKTGYLSDIQKKNSSIYET